MTPVLLILLLASIGAAGAGGIAGAAETPLPGFIADLRTTVTFPRAQRLMTEAKILKAGPLVRYEDQDKGDEVQIYDFAGRRSVRLILAQQMAFETIMPPRFLSNAKREGLAPAEPEPGIVIQRLRLGEAVIEGHPCDIILLVKSLSGRKGRRLTKEYTLIWEARDLGLPLKVSYSQPDFSVVLVEYRNLRLASFEPALFQPPAGFLQASPF